MAVRTKLRPDLLQHRTVRADHPSWTAGAMPAARALASPPGVRFYLLPCGSPGPRFRACAAASCSQLPGYLGYGNTQIIGDQAGEMGDHLGFIDLGTGRTAKALAADPADDVMCAILDTDQVKCWGSDAEGQLGDGDTLNRGNAANQMGDDLPFADLATLSVNQVSTSGRNTCAIVSPGKIRCWGEGASGGLGDGSTANHGDQPNEMGGNLGEVPIGGTPELVHAGDDFACAVTTSGLYCWGENSDGELGLGDTMNRGVAPGQVAALAPIDLGTQLDVVELTSGIRFVCARFSDGSIKCWGNGNYGELGTGAVTDLGVSAGQMGTSLPFVSLQ
jgi:hypothetical protein